MDLETTLTPIALATGIAGLLSPFITALVNRPGWSTQTKQLTALGVSILLGVIGLVLGGAISNVPATPAAWGVALFAVVGISQALYAVILKTTGIGPALERATAPKDAGTVAPGQAADISSLPPAQSSLPPADTTPPQDL